MASGPGPSVRLLDILRDFSGRVESKIRPPVTQKRRVSPQRSRCSGARILNSLFCAAAARPAPRQTNPPFFILSPVGATGCSHGWSGAAAQRPDAQPVERKEESGYSLSSCRPGGATEVPKPTKGKRFLRPSGAGLTNTHLSHGLRCAPPVATLRGPVGAETRLPGLRKMTQWSFAPRSGFRVSRSPERT